MSDATKTVLEDEKSFGKDRESGANKRRQERKAKKHNKQVQEMLISSAGKKTESMRDGAKPLKQKIKNTGKRCKSDRHLK